MREVTFKDFEKLMGKHRRTVDDLVDIFRGKLDDSRRSCPVNNSPRQTELGVPIFIPLWRFPHRPRTRSDMMRVSSLVLVDRWAVAGEQVFTYTQ
jgi:hypothetical protein